jgi:hypothetical protein
MRGRKDPMRDSFIRLVPTLGDLIRGGHFTFLRADVLRQLRRKPVAPKLYGWARTHEQRRLRDDPSTWDLPVVRIACPEGGPFADAGTVPVLWEAYDQLIGSRRWRQRHGMGGAIPVRFPSDDDPGDAGWHIDGSYAMHDRLWVNVHSRERGLLALFLITDVDEECAPTRLRPGSHLDVPAILAPAGEDGSDWFVAAVQAAEASADRPTIPATGKTGDVFLCHPFLVHAASWPHRGRSPRIIAQPEVALLEPYALRTSSGSPPVEQAILGGLALFRSGSQGGR